MATLSDDGGVQGHANRDNMADMVYLPISMGYQNCYKRYMHSLGYKIRCKPDRAEYIVDGIIDGKPSDHGFVSFSAYYKKWKREYPRLKCNWPAEDICNQCFVFANRHRYLANHSMTETLATMAAAATTTEATTNKADNGNTTAVATTTEATNNDSNTPAATTLTETTNDDGDATAAATTTEATNNDGDTSAAVITTEATNNDSNTTVATTPTEARITEDDDDDDDNNGDTAATTTEETPAPISIDQPESAATEVKEAREQLLLVAAKHVKMAREQRSLYRALVAEAVCDATDGKSHSERRYTFVVDNGQNMQVPIFNNEQPGSTYYFSLLSVYNLGMVDHAHVYNDGRISEHVHCHVYNEAVAKKGSNNVASLIVKTLRQLNLL